MTIGAGLGGKATAAAHHAGAPPHPTWRATDSLAGQRASHQAVRLDSGKVMVLGGSSREPSTPARLLTAELYSPSAGTWSPAAPMTDSRDGFSATKLRDGRVLVFGGWDHRFAGGPMSAPELYDPAENEWTDAPEEPLREPRHDHAATMLADGRVLFTGGTLGFSSYETLAEIFDPATGEWTRTGSMQTGRFRHTATLLKDGRVLVVGGTNMDEPGEADAIAELWDPATGEWSRADGLANPQHGHTATRLRDGRVLVAGFAGIETFDPRTGEWTWGPYVDHPFAGHTASLMPSGHVLVAGGDPSGPNALLLDPSTGEWSPLEASVPENGGHSATVLASGNVLIAGGSTDRAELFGLDRRGPRVWAPAAKLPVGGAIDGTGRVPLRLSLRGWDAQTAFTDLRWTVEERSADARAWTPWDSVLAGEPGRYLTRYAIPGLAYQHRARAVDLAGYESAAVAGSELPVELLAQDGSHAAYTGEWQTAVARDGATAGTVATSAARGAAATFTFTGRSAALVLPFREDLGVARVCLDPGTAGERCFARDLSPASGAFGPRKLLLPFNGLSTDAPHQISVTVLRGRVDVDGLALVG